MMKSFFYFLFLSLILSVSLVFSFIAYISVDLPDLEQIGNKRVSQSTKIYDRDEKVLLYEVHGEEKRTVISFEEIPKTVREATIAVEDKNFYQHPAFDWKAILRSVFIDVFYNKRVGGSTITQQLAKNSFLSSEQSIIRKAKELILALRLEKKYSKDEILALYLNQIPYGGNTYGIAAAAQTFFNKDVANLTLGETAILVSLPQSPTYYSPYGLHKDELFLRRDYVLDQMKKSGFVSKEDGEEAKKEDVVFAPQSAGIKAPHFVMMVLDYLTEKYGEDMIENGGLKVSTTLNFNLQQIAEKTVKEGAESNFNLYKGRNAALIAEEPETGQIVALVGSADYFDVENEGNFNVAAQGLRQPGSAFKPFAYLEAFIKGYTPETVVFDVPTEFTTGKPEECPALVDFNNDNKKCYHPENFDNDFKGPISLRNSLAQSVNVPSVKTLYLAGLDNTLELAKKFGLTTLEDKSRFGLSLVLGGGEVKLTELVNAYSAFAQDGTLHKQSFILRVEDGKGSALEEYRDETSQAAEPQYVKILNDVLLDTKARSGLFHASLSLTVIPDYQVALKTGTTNNYIDAWTMGYTPNLAVGVWEGNNRREPMERNGSSILAALPIWNSFFKEAIKNYPPETFTKPESSVAEKPILKGDYLFANQIHNILYFVDKDNPRGLVPQNPENDPQFYNWETAVLVWAKNNLPNFESYNKSKEYNYSTTNEKIFSVKIETPSGGSFIKGTQKITAKIASTLPVKKIEAYINQKVVETKNGDFGKDFNFSMSVGENNFDLQNLVKVKAYTDLGEAEDSVIVYK